MAKSKEYSAVTLVLNNTCKLTKGAPLKVGDGYVRGIGQEDIGFLTDIKTPFSDHLTHTHKAFFRPIDSSYQENQLSIQKEALAFALNFSGNSQPIILGETHVFVKGRKKRREYLLPSSNAVSNDYLKQAKYNLPSNVKPIQVAEIYNICTHAVSASSSFLITLSRFNSCLIRHDRNDQYLDLAIALESIITAGSEISFQFSILNSILAEKKPEKRLAIYALLKKFYNVRSKLVHGVIENKYFLTKDELSKVHAVAKLNILHKAQFLASGKTGAEWKKHQINLMLGVPSEGS